MIFITDEEVKASKKKVDESSVIISVSKSRKQGMVIEMSHVKYNSANEYYVYDSNGQRDLVKYNEQLCVWENAEQRRDRFEIESYDELVKTIFS
jgi:hypothetical protein